MPVGVDAPAFIVMIEDPEPGDGMGCGLKLAVAPEGKPDAFSAIAELNRSETVVLIVHVAGDPCATVTEDGEAEIVKGRGICGPGATCTTEDPFT